MCRLSVSGFDMKGVPYSNAGVLEATWAHRGRHSRINIQWKRPLQDSTGIRCSLFSRIAKASSHFQTCQILFPHAPHFALRLAQFPTKFTLHSPYSSSSLDVSEDWRKFLRSIHKSIGLQLHKDMGDACSLHFTTCTPLSPPTLRTGWLHQTASGKHVTSQIASITG